MLSAQPIRIQVQLLQQVFNSPAFSFTGIKSLLPFINSIINIAVRQAITCVDQAPS